VAFISHRAIFQLTNYAGRNAVQSLLRLADY